MSSVTLTSISAAALVLPDINKQDDSKGLKSRTKFHFLLLRNSNTNQKVCGMPGLFLLFNNEINGSEYMK